LTKDNLFNKKKDEDKIKEKGIIENFILDINYILEKIKKRKYITKNFDNIQYKDFVEEICYYYKYKETHTEKKDNILENLYHHNLVSINKLNYYENNYDFENKLNRDLEITIFKVKLGERFVSAFEENKVINQIWKNGTRNIDIINSSILSNEDSFSLEFNEILIKNNIDKITNILPTNLPMICKPNN
jgi:hypothetical protein